MILLHMANNNGYFRLDKNEKCITINYKFYNFKVILYFGMSNCEIFNRVVIDKTYICMYVYTYICTHRELVYLFTKLLNNGSYFVIFSTLITW